ncbi:MULTISPECIES: hypothetical protein [Streptomyces]|uniref:hypothetical protein n=1 Tax=Streptomyces TaxID=1883 RepID=UPI0013C539A7|nr:hypothetical protein [Streptomyces scabiei]MDX3519704.1 hypothetical protein [Streptomyces scabiei]
MDQDVTEAVRERVRHGQFGALGQSQFERMVPHPAPCADEGQVRAFTTGPLREVVRHVFVHARRADELPVLGGAGPCTTAPAS